eukprot:8856409-Pyramimonas_sp.AAC.1
MILRVCRKEQPIFVSDCGGRARAVWCDDIRGGAAHAAGDPVSGVEAFAVPEGNQRAAARQGAGASP